MARTSNDTGRAFEYLITKKVIDMLKDNKIDFSITKRAEMSNKKDSNYLKSLSKALRNNLNSGAESFIEWLKYQRWFKSGLNISIDRLSDEAGIKGDPTDIKITIGDETKQFSVKHNHNALKHPRLPRLPDQCGIYDTQLKNEYNSKMDAVWEDFAKKAKKLDTKVTEFNKLRSKDPDFINSQLYKPLIEIVCTFLRDNANNPQNASIFFDFLTGNSNFYTIKNESKNILVKHFANLKKPTSFKIQYPYNSDTTFLLTFDNGWKLTFRLHTATTHYVKNNKLTKSTKFDVICINIEEVIKIDKLNKKN